MHQLEIATTQRTQMTHITRHLNALVVEQDWKNGALLIFCPHTTAGLTINEAADPDVQRDMCMFMNRLVPDQLDFMHAEGNSDAHIKSSLFGPQCMVIVEEGVIRLGTWQGIYFCEWDGPRKRTVLIQFLPSTS